MRNNYTVISLGGSLIAPEGINTDYIKDFCDTIEDLSSQQRFFVVVGGGNMARIYHAAAKILGVTDASLLDQLGIEATYLNAGLVRDAVGVQAHSEVIKDPTVVPDSDKSVIFAGGWRPGWSTDYVAVQAAITLGVRVVINLSNVEYVYSADPKLISDAKRYSKLTWNTYRSFIPSEWEPGLKTPFDPLASKLAEENDIDVVMAGDKLTNIRSWLDQGIFTGTLLSNHVEDTPEN